MDETRPHEPSNAADPPVCPRCAAQNRSGATFCYNCGEAVPGTGDAPDAAERLGSPRLGSPMHVPRWHLHRRLYNWVIGLAEKRHATSWLFALSFSESSFFPIPPDVLLIPLVLGSRRRAFRFAAWCTVASVAGGMLGYLIGLGPLRFLFDHLARIYHFEGDLEYVLAELNRYGFWFVFVAGFTPIPYKVFTIAAGISRMNVAIFVAASLIGRGARFFLVAGLLYVFGPPIKRWIDKYFNWVCLAFAVLLVGGFYAMRHFRG